MNILSGISDTKIAELASEMKPQQLVEAARVKFKLGHSVEIPSLDHFSAKLYENTSQADTAELIANTFIIRQFAEMDLDNTTADEAIGVFNKIDKKIATIKSDQDTLVSMWQSMGLKSSLAQYNAGEVLKIYYLIIERGGTLEQSRVIKTAIETGDPQQALALLPKKIAEDEYVRSNITMFAGMNKKIAEKKEQQAKRNDKQVFNTLYISSDLPINQQFAAAENVYGKMSDAQMKHLTSVQVDDIMKTLYRLSSLYEKNESSLPESYIVNVGSLLGRFSTEQELREEQRTQALDLAESSSKEMAKYLVENDSKFRQEFARITNQQYADVDVFYARSENARQQALKAAEIFYASELKLAQAQSDAAQAQKDWDEIKNDVEIALYVSSFVRMMKLYDEQNRDYDDKLWSLAEKVVAQPAQDAGLQIAQEKIREIIQQSRGNRLLMQADSSVCH